VTYTCHPRDGRKHKIGRLQSRPFWTKNKTLSPEKKGKRTGSVVQLIKHPRSKYKSLSSNSIYICKYVYAKMRVYR
jgi:hypothetical protein